MGTILRPNATVSNEWSIGNHTNVDEEVTQPAAGDDDCLVATNGDGDDNQVVVLGFPNTITDVDEVTNITVWTYGGRFGNNSPEVDVNMGGWQGYLECTLAADPNWSWTSDSFDGSWTQADLDGLQVRYRADVPDKYNTNYPSVVYVVVTYIPTAPVGYGHDFMGVPAANIDNVCGVPAANIDKIKGV